MSVIFETKRLLVRHLILDDFEAFHEMHANIKVMQYVRGKAMSYEENQEELPKLIKMYYTKENDFWIYAIRRKQDGKFLGTVALVKDKNDDDEIGYRFLEKYWRKGYGAEIVDGLIKYCKSAGFKKIIACVVMKNVASKKIIENAGFLFVKNFISEDLNLPEIKYSLEL